MGVCEIDLPKKDTFRQRTVFFSRFRSFNVIRLCLSWNALEPTPGKYSDMYLARVEQVLLFSDDPDNDLLDELKYS